MIRIPANFVDETGNQYDRLIVLKRVGSDKFGNATWLCLCNCGKESVVRGVSLRAGRIRSCGCLKIEKWREWRLLPLGVAAMHRKLADYQRGAKRRSLNWKLTEEQFINLTSQSCRYCGAPPANIARYDGINGDFIYSGIDRLDNVKGYILENSVPCCSDCNGMKSTHSEQDFLAHIKRIAQHQGWL